MGVPIALAVFIACVIAIAILGNPQNEQIDANMSAKLSSWRRYLFAVEVVAAMVLVWQVGFRWDNIGSGEFYYLLEPIFVFKGLLANKIKVH